MCASPKGSADPILSRAYGQVNSKRLEGAGVAQVISRKAEGEEWYMQHEVVLGQLVCPTRDVSASREVHPTGLLHLTSARRDCKWGALLCA